MDESTADRVLRRLETIERKLDEMLAFRDQVTDFALGRFGAALVARKARKVRS